MWLYNFEEELQKISELVETYPMIAMDTEFPGVVIEEVSFALSAKEQVHREYLKIKANADALKIIQIGITLSDESGKMPSPVSTW